MIRRTEPLVGMSTPNHSGGAHSTRELLARFRAGDPDALNVLFAEYVPDLQRWASGRLPMWARDLADTSDLVQDTVLQTFRNLNAFEPQDESSLRAYLRRALMNRIRDEFRRTYRRPDIGPLDDDLVDSGTSPSEAAIGAEAVARYEVALARLTEDERDAVVARVELGLTYPEIARTLERPSADAARMAVGRALVRLAEEMKRGKDDRVQR